MIGTHPVELGVVDVKSTSTENDPSLHQLRLGNLEFAEPLWGQLEGRL